MDIDPRDSDRSRMHAYSRRKHRKTRSRYNEGPSDGQEGIGLLACTDLSPSGVPNLNPSTSGKRRRSSNATHSTLETAESMVAGPTRPEPTPMEIPGFYYDPTRKRYFKILPNQSVPRGHRFTAENVLLLKQAESQRLHESTPPPKIAPGRNRLAYLLARELIPSTKTHRQLSNTGPWSYNSLAREILLKTAKYVGALKPTLNHMPQWQITDFQIQSARNDIYFGRTDGLVCLLRFECSTVSCSEIFSLPVTQFSSEVTSVRLGPQNFIVCTSLGNDACPGTLHVGKTPTKEYELSTGELLAPQFAFTPSKTSLWTSAVTQTDTTIALGASKKVIIVQGWDCQNVNTSNITTNSDAFAVQFNRGKPSLVYAGCRDGFLRLFDLRAYRKSLSSSYGVGPLIQQSSAICHLEEFGDWYVVSSGMNGSLSMWDIRSAKSSGTNLGSRDVRGKSIPPILKFHDNVNEHTRRLGFAINTDESVIAAAGQDNRLRLYSLNTGHMLRDPIGPLDDSIAAIRYCGWGENTRKNEYYDSGISLSGHGDTQRQHLGDDIDKRGEGIWVAVGGGFKWWAL